ncbi:MAG: IS110 family transposase [Thermoguttaceae bacterium]|nr:IS110 family transposase [Thermoguttaceae bacterium]
MNAIVIKIGMDVHSVNYTLCALTPILGADDCVLATVQVAPDYKNVLSFIENLKDKLGRENKYDIQCGYEAGCLGYSLYRSLKATGVKCVILAPTTMLSQRGKRVKTDVRDALVIAQCLAHGGYHAVYIPSEDDNSVKEYLRMRDDHQNVLKRIKQQINAFLLRLGYCFPGTKWTKKHRDWLKNLELSELNQETLTEYLVTFEELESKIERLDKRIKELSGRPRYVEKVKRLGCFLGISVHTALSLIVETGDFKRFAKGNIYAAYLGLVPGEHSSGNHTFRTGISKAGNSHLRRLLTESGHGICKGRIGVKSKELRSRQLGNPSEVVAYADKANERLRRRYYKMIRRGKKRNVAVAAIARELACFVWGMMTDAIRL